MKTHLLFSLSCNPSAYVKTDVWTSKRLYIYEQNDTKSTGIYLTSDLTNFIFTKLTVRNRKVPIPKLPQSSYDGGRSSWTF
ncbi:hypothetical protein B565_0440 [Aeromonas veronii B565]|nr:hypothetical protein B565_0440 [Aeromonas veronii B565]